MKAYFAGGCFWGIEDAFRSVDGVRSTRVGYAGGNVPNPTYELVCTGKTGHAETVEVEYDPKEVTYEELLDIFWQLHDPTTLNRQGPDIGTQYRSAIFYTTPEQERAARSSKDAIDASGKLRGPVVTQIEPAREFYEAEEYHQCYFEKQRR